MSAEYFEELYRRDPDPWDLASSDYERDKYARTVAAVGGHRGRALEVGCSIGVLTAALAPLCDELLAVDASERAVAAARERVAGLPHVRVERRAVPEDMPSGPFDLIVCSEVLYYWDARGLAPLWDRLRTELAPGGAILAVHWRGPVRHYPQDGDAVHALLRARAGDLTVGATATLPRFRLDRFDRAA